MSLLNRFIENNKNENLFQKKDGDWILTGASTLGPQKNTAN